MAKSSLRKAAQNRAAKRPTFGAGDRATRAAAADKVAGKASKQGLAGGFSFKGSNRSAAYRGAAGEAIRAGMGSLNADRAGKKAEQAYAG